MPENMSKERQASMQAYGAELILVSREVGMEVVPILETKCVIRPCVCCQISGPVEIKCALGLSELLNWSNISLKKSWWIV